MPIHLWDDVEDETFHGLVTILGDEGEPVGEVNVQVVEGNVVITVEREDEAKFGPVSLVVL